MPMKSALNWKVAGPAGEGIKTTGLLFSKMCLRHGLFTFDYTEYPSLIRGGHNTYQVVASTKKVYSQEFAIDVLIALNENAIKFHKDELTPESIVVYDGVDANFDIATYALPCPAYNVPLAELARAAGGERVMANNVSLGVSAALFNLDLAILDQVIADVFAGKNAEVVSLNQKSARAGYEFALKNCKKLESIAISKQTPVDTLSLFGNEAIALGLVAGGMKAYIAYPMTPSSSILHSLADWEEKADIFVKHAEDEIGVINMALGMSYAGVRAAVGTSGGGICYMSEAIGLAGIAELPLTIIESQRPGPAVGMPTWTAQPDLLFCINIAQDEFPRIVVAPGDIKEAFDLAEASPRLAEKYQIPVILMSDKQLSESAQSTSLPVTVFSHEQVSVDLAPQVNETGFYPRYKVTESGISPRTIPGQPNGQYISNGYETDAQGIASEESKDRIEQMDKRFRKMDLIMKEIPEQFYDGSDHPEITFISWGSTKLATMAAIDRLRAQGIDAAVFNLSWMWPFPTDQVLKVLEKSQTPVIVEGNKTFQLARLIRQETGIDIYHKRSKYDGRPFYPFEIIGYAREILGK